MPAVSVTSLMPIGRPCSGPSGAALHDGLLGGLRRRTRLVRGQRDDGIELRVDPLDDGEMRIEHLDRAGCAGADQRRKFARGPAGQ